MFDINTNQLQKLNKSIQLHKNNINFVIKHRIISEYAKALFVDEIVDLAAKVLSLCDQYRLKSSFSLGILHGYGTINIYIFPSLYDRCQDERYEISIAFDNKATVSLPILFMKFLGKEPITILNNLNKENIFDIINEIYENRFYDNLINGEYLE